LSAWIHGRRLALVLTLALAAVAGLVLALRAAGSARPGPFYLPPRPLPAGPAGTLIREQGIPNLYPGARAYRVLYKTTGLDRGPAVASGIVVVPEGPAPRHGRPVVAYTHGDVGVARGCAPSLRTTGAGQFIEGLGQFIAAGDVVAATDYAGLGTPGPYAYLSGPVAAMNAIDIVRAARHLKEAHAGRSFAVWGHSEGGQAALFTAQLAASYAPGLHLVGAAAGAPVAEPAKLFRIDSATAGAKQLIAMALTAWAQAFHAPAILEVLAPSARATAAAVAQHCLYGKEAVSLSAQAGAITFAAAPEWRSEPWRRILAEATPGGRPISVPLLMIQGGADKLIRPVLTERLARRLCTAGEPVELRLYPAAEHAEAGIVASPDVAAWIAGRFAGAPAPSTCQTVPAG
jgi:pimeloyl-ACP methyl ester carboxylesterase